MLLFLLICLLLLFFVVVVFVNFVVFVIVVVFVLLVIVVVLYENHCCQLKNYRIHLRDLMKRSLVLQEVGFCILVSSLTISQKHQLYVLRSHSNNTWHFFWSFWPPPRPPLPLCDIRCYYFSPLPPSPPIVWRDNLY